MNSGRERLSRLAILSMRLDPALIGEEFLELEPWQRDVIRNRGSDLITAARQQGKSTCLALKVLWETLFLPYSYVLLFSASENQSKELFQKMMAFYGAFRDTFPPAQESEMSIRLVTGNRVKALPSKSRTVRGYSRVTRLVLDEAVEVSGDLYKAARPMLRRSKGSISAMSQAGFDEGWFFEEFSAGCDTEEESMKAVDGWVRQWVPADEAADPKFFADELRVMGPERFGREYRCRFTRLKTATGNQPFAPELVRKAFTDEITPLFGGV